MWTYPALETIKQALHVLALSYPNIDTALQHFIVKSSQLPSKHTLHIRHLRSSAKCEETFL